MGYVGGGLQTPVRLVENLSHFPNMHILKQQGISVQSITLLYPLSPEALVELHLEKNEKYKIIKFC